MIFFNFLNLVSYIDFAWILRNENHYLTEKVFFLLSVDSKYGISCRSNTKKSENPACNFDWTEKCETIESRLAQGLIFSNRDRKGETPLMFLSVTLVVNLHPRLTDYGRMLAKSLIHTWKPKFISDTQIRVTSLKQLSVAEFSGE